MKVKFIDVGRKGANWTAECLDKELTDDWLLNQVRPHLLSSYIDFHESGNISAGFRTVGRFEILKETKEKDLPDGNLKRSTD